MITQFNNLCQKFAQSTIVNARKYAKKNYVSEKRKNIQRQMEKLRKQELLKENKDRTPLITTKRPEYNFYEGDTFNKFIPVLITQGWFHQKSKKDYFTIHPVKDKSVKDVKILPFDQLGFSPEFIKNLENNGIKNPTNIQMKSFPKLLQGRNTIIADETGKGKTLAYLLPLVEQVKQFKKEEERGLNTPLGLIMTPSRELAFQIQKEAKKLTMGTDIKIKYVSGGRIKKKLRNPSVSECDILVGTLGAISKYTTCRVYKLHHLQHVILDEADSLFHITFQEKLKPFLDKIEFAYDSKTDSETEKSKGAQLTLVSATMPTHISSVLRDIVNVSSFTQASTPQLHRVKVPQHFIRLGANQKPMYLLKLVKEKKRPIIVFTNTSKMSNWLTYFLTQFNLKSISLNAKLPMDVRKERFSMFQHRNVNILCTTDAGSRGLDTIDVQEVINYDFPLQTAEYIHRCGRTGRIGSPKDGKVINFISRPLEIILARKIEIATKKGGSIPIIDMLNKTQEMEYKSLVDQMEIDKESSTFNEDNDASSDDPHNISDDMNFNEEISKYASNIDFYNSNDKNDDETYTPY